MRGQIPRFLRALLCLPALLSSFTPRVFHSSFTTSWKTFSATTKRSDLRDATRKDPTATAANTIHRFEDLKFLRVTRHFAVLDELSRCCREYFSQINTLSESISRKWMLSESIAQPFERKKLENTLETNSREELLNGEVPQVRREYPSIGVKSSNFKWPPRKKSNYLLKLGSNDRNFQKIPRCFTN